MRNIKREINVIAAENMSRGIGLREVYCIGGNQYDCSGNQISLNDTTLNSIMNKMINRYRQHEEYIRRSFR